MKQSAVLLYGSPLLLAAACGGDAAPPGSPDGIPTTTATPTTASPAPTTTSGTYELFVGEFSPRDGEPRGVYDVFTVAG